MKLLSVAIQTELIASKMDSTSSFSAANYTNLTTTQPPPGELVYDPLWAVILRWIIGVIIITVGRHSIWLPFLGDFAVN